MTDIRTLDRVLDAVKSAVENREAWSPDLWAECAWDMTALLGNEHDRLCDMQQIIAAEKGKLVDEGFTVARAKVAVESTDIYKESQKLKSKIGRIEELIRISKLRSRMAMDEYRT